MKEHTNKTRATERKVLRRALVLLAAVFTAITVAVACVLCLDVSKPVDVNGVEQDIAQTSSTLSNPTGDYTGVGKLKNGDVLNYSYSGGYYSIKLPKGKYKLEVWGAQGGYYTNSTSSLGGKGGYTYATYEVTSTSGQYIYIYIGGQGKSGTGSNKTGGYNGGGTVYIGNGGGAGGGATHMATTSGLLSALKSNQSAVLLVGGGGGGSTTNAHSGTYGLGGAGGGGNNNGGASTGGWIDGSGYQAGGGTQTSGGRGGKGATTSSCSYVIGQSGDFGKGGVSYGATNSTGGYEAGGGGGGGWWGGGGGGGDSNSAGADGRTGGGGGSGHIKTGLSGGGTSGNWSGNGKARINVISVNQGPVSKNATIQNASAANYYRGTSRNLNISASSLASDNDYANTSGATVNSVYFSNGSSSNYDTLPGTNAGLYLNSACTTSASAYLSWKWTNNQTLTITDIKKYPRNGVDGCTSNGRLTLYTKMRDSFGTTTTRGITTVMFYFVVNDRPITAASDTFKRINRTANGKTYEYRYGNPTHTGADAAKLDHVGNVNNIYNPVQGATQKTVFLPKPIAPTDTSGYTIYASDIFTDADTAYDKVGFRSVAVTSGTTNYSSYYTVTYNADGNYASGVVPSITIKPSSIRPPSAIYVCLTITAQTSETASKVAIGAQNTAVRLVFRLANTRPYFASSSAINTGLSEPYVELDPGQSKTISLSQMIKDIDDSSLSSYFAQGSDGVKVPVNEYIQVDASNIAVPLRSDVGSNYYGKTSVNTTAGKLSSATGEGTTPTGFKTDVIAANGSAAASTAAVVYSFDNNNTIRFTARAATQYMYGQSGRLGDFYVLVRVVDPADVSDTGIWYPIAIKVRSSAPSELPTVANFDLTFDGSFTAGIADTPTSIGRDAVQNTPEGVILTPISYIDGNGAVQGIGTTSYEFNTENGHAKPFAIDPDTFMYSGNGVAKTRALNDIMMLDGTRIADVVNLYDTSSFFKVELISLYANREVFSRLGMSAAQLAAFGVRTFSGDNGDVGYEFYGLKVTPLRSTDSEYFQFDVKLKDSHDAKGTVRICIKIANRAVQARRGNYTGQTPPITTAYALNPSASGEYVYNRSIGALAVNYEIERNDVVQITPYDLAYDLDMDSANAIMNVNGLNTNPTDAGFSEVAAYVNRQYNIPHTSSVNSPATSATPVYAQRLTFINTDNFIANANQYSAYISATVENSCIVGGTEYAVPCIKIVGLSRTTSAVVQLRFTIGDGSSSIDCIVTVTVKNAAPILNTEENHPKENEEDFRVSEPYNMSAEIGGELNNAYQFTARQLAYDKDGDIPTFISGSARIVAKVGGEYYDMLDADFNGVSSVDDAVYKLSDYVQTTLTKNGMGDDVVYIKALSSTELFPVPVYLEFKVQDGFRAQPQTSTLHLLINVRNSKPVFVTDNLMMTNDSEGEEEYSWQISYENKSETKIPRYIFNSKELSDSGVISTASSNKTWLFDDSDAAQSAMLNPLKWVNDDDIVNNYTENLIAKVSGTRVDGNAFGLNPNAAVIYTAIYPSEEVAKQYLALELLFFEKYIDGTGNVAFRALGNDNPAVMTSRYWALKIVDNAGSNATAISANIAIAIKDDHHGKPVYSADKTTSQTGDSALTVFNLFYSYKTPGITAMHTYYRTDGNAEANTPIGGAGENTVYALQINGFDSDRSYQFDGPAPTTQEALQKATFTERFKYQYFAKTITRTSENDETEVEVTYKYYPDSQNAFYYEPIQVGAGGVADTVVPMSYMAMPKASDAGTVGDRVHVTFANANDGPKLQGSNKLLDDEYLNWGDPTNLQYVFENLTLTDVNGATWSGATLNDNPYITIGYAKDPMMLKTAYVNDKRYTLEASGESQTVGRKRIEHKNSDGSSIYHEDKYGFTFAKKTGGRRSTGTLKLTLALKTSVYAANEYKESAVEYVDVEINLANSKPTVSYNDVSLVGYIDNLNVNMTTSDVNGKVVSLNDKANVETAVGDYKLYYSDPDSTDTMKFLLSSATGEDASDMTPSERDYITQVSNMSLSPTAFEKYYRVAESDNNITIDGTPVTLNEYKEQYVPNPGYNKFFEISPSNGASSTIQIIPKAKTQLNIPSGTSASDRKAILDEYNLLEDGNGIYYPFRILFYDEINGSPITEGSWGAAILKVYIDNDPIKVDTSVVTDKYTAAGAYRNTPNYKFKLSKGTDFFVDVSSLLVDNDIKLDGTSFAVDNASFTPEEKLFNDYLVMPDPDDHVKVAPSNGKLPIVVGAPDASSGMPASTLRFKANNAFKGTVDLLYTFGDSVADVTGTGGSSVKIMFSITYNNENPTANVDTFGGSESINIVMKTGDSFTLYAADSNLFAGDADGGFNSIGYVNGYVTERAADYFDAFHFKTAGTYTENSIGALGSLIVGSDDAPSTLRFSKWDAFANPNDASMFDIAVGKRYQCEFSSNMLPMSVTLKALGVTDTVYTLTLIDGEQTTTTVNINITVLPTAPTASDSLLPKGMTKVEGSDNTYAISLEYGESREYTLRSFMKDVDLDDISGLEVYRNVDNSQYSIDNPVGISAISVESTKVLTQNAIYITATDFIPTEGEYSSVSFRVADAHGAISDFITINVSIAPKEVEVIATQTKVHKATLKSYADYEADGRSVYIDLVAPVGEAVLLSDRDALAPSARYDVEVYALVKKNADGVFSQLLRPTDAGFVADDCRLVTVSSSGISFGSGEIVDYVERFFTVSLSSDGKTLEFIPNSATIAAESNNAALGNIRLYIVAAKRYINGDKQTMTSKQAFADISVANSALVAVPSSPVNSGYPMIKVGEDEERLRESAFLEFTGSAGDSLTWDLYNNLDPDLGLFYDYDLINNPAIKVDRPDGAGSVNVGGLETINFVKAEIGGISETVSGKGDVISVTPSGDGKKLTVKINRKVFTGQPPKDGNTKSYTDVKVDIYCADTIGMRSGITNTQNLVKTTINVRVENDVPEIKEVTDPALISKLGYSLTYSDVEGYVLDAKLEKGDKLSLNIPDFIDDADIDMDEYVLLYTGSENSLITSSGVLMGSTSLDGTNDGIGRIKQGSSTLFTVRLVTSSNSYAVSTLSKIEFTCESVARGAIGTCHIQLRDSVQGAVTRILTVNITVDNIAPKVKPDINTSITMMGIGKDGTEEDMFDAAKSYLITDFVTDENGDSYLATDPENAEKLPTYVFVDAILVYDLDDPINKPYLYGPNLKVVNEDTGIEEYSTTTLCRIDWAETDDKHQTFRITPIAGVYGVQKITLTVVDSGYEDGASAGVQDGKTFDLNLTITVANPLEDVAEVLDGKNIAYGVTRAITVEELLGEENAQGYEIDSIVEDGTNNLGIFAPGQQATYTSADGSASENKWRIYARTEGAVNTVVTFRAGDVTRVRTLPITVVPNQKPVLKGDKNIYDYTVSMLTDNVARTLKIYPEDWFDDFDEGDIMTFVSPIASSQSVMVEAVLDFDTAADGGRAFIMLKFNRRGASDITLNVSDKSGKLYEYTITVNCTDAPELSWWENIVSLIESNWMWFWIIVGASLLFIILLIIIIVVVHKKRKMRREIEALLNAETELEEEMMRLSASSAPYQSFGFLPPTNPAVNDPGLMIGGSPTNPAPNSLQLNAGTGMGTKPQNQQIPPAGMPNGGQGNVPPAGNDGFDPDDF